MRNKNKPDFLKLLNYNLSYNTIFENLFKTTSEILDKQIGEPISQLSRIRSSTHIKRGDYLDVDNNGETHRGRVADVKLIQNPDGSHQAKITLGLGNGTAVVVYRDVLQDRRTLVNQAAFAGVDYYSDYISDVEYARLVDYVGSYWKYQNSGEQNFIDFIGFIKGMRLSLVQLWTADQTDYATSEDPGFNFYEYLIPEEEVTDPMKIVGTSTVGTEYLTSHVDLEYDVIASPNVLFNDLINLFYYFAPIELVLNRIIGSITVEMETYAGLAPQIDGNLLATYEWQPKIVLDSYYTTPITQIDSNLGSYLFLDSVLEETDPEYTPYNHVWEDFPRFISRAVQINAHTSMVSNTILEKALIFHGQSHFVSNPNRLFVAFTVNGQSIYNSKSIKNITIPVQYEVNSLLTVIPTVSIHRNSEFTSQSTFESNYNIDIIRSIEYEGQSTTYIIYGGDFDGLEFDESFS